MVPDSTDGFKISFSFVCGGGGGDSGGVGGAAACFLLYSDPICNWPLYFLRMPSLWYFQNCLDASLPPTL